MKKIFTTLVVLLVTITVFAQPDHKEDWNRNTPQDDYAYSKRNENGKYDDRFKRNYYFTPREREMEIREINRRYDYKIQAVQNRFFMARYERIRQIRQLEQERECAVKEVWEKFNSRRNMYNYDRRKRYDHY